MHLNISIHLYNQMIKRAKTKMQGNININLYAYKKQADVIQRDK